MTAYPPEVQLLNLRLHNLTRAELLERLTEGVFINPNTDVLMKLQHDRALHQIVENAEWRVCDSQILVLASRFLGTPIKERISGSDFFGEFCAHHAGNPALRVFALGSAPGVAARAAEVVNGRVGREIISHAHSPSFGFEYNREESRRIVELINASGCSVLAIGVGCPKQEKWVAAWRDQMPGVRLYLCIGATFDFEAGVKPRAPRWMSDLGLEWLFRMLSEPKRLVRRYLVDDLPFFRLLWQQKRGTYRSPF